ncbi:MAG: ABC transporter permease [Pseudomonadales bacterium]
MKDLLYLSLQYIRHHRAKLAVLTFAITLVSWLPLALESIVDQTAQQLLQRADTTPMVIGAPGSPLELSLGSLYFRSKTATTLPYSDVAELVDTGLAKAIPLYYHFRVQNYPVVGTSPDYFEYRGLHVAAGRHGALLGEAVIGAAVAKSMGIGVGDHVITSPENVFDLAGVYPLKMSVVGVLAPSLSPDDEAIFVDIKTCWVIQGLGHGHQELNRKEAVGQILKREGDNIIANASVRQFNEITADNLDSFHFHGDTTTNPISAIIPVPRDEKSAALLLGHYQEERVDVQVVRSKKVISELLDTVFTVRNYIVVGVALVAAATGIIAVLVFYLSLRLRKGERHTLSRIGASQLQVQTLMATEIVTVLLLSSLFSGLLVLVTQHYGMTLMQQLLLN